MARPNRNDYPPGDAGNKQFDDADFAWQKSNNLGAKQGGSAGGVEVNPNYSGGAKYEPGTAAAPIDSKINKGLGDLAAAAAERKRKAALSTAGDQAKALRGAQ